MILRRAFLLLLTLVLPYAGWSQGITVIGIPHSSTSKGKSNGHAAGRTQDIVPLTLPFWDDFSTADSVSAARYLYGSSVLLNNGMAINPPSIGVITFDGLDSLGKPYNTTDVLAKGYADRLISYPIDLSGIDDAHRDSVFFSYQYQLEGNGELPDDGDRLLVSFHDNNDEWVPVDTINNDGSLETDIFYTSVIQISDDKFFHDGFQFMIQNFGRLSGPYDAWHLDYIYLNKRRWPTDTSFPDRTVSTTPTSLFGQYWIMPIDHFVANGGVMSQPSITATNMRAGNLQPVNFSTIAKITSFSNNVKTSVVQNLDIAQDFDTPLVTGTFQQISSAKLPDVLTYANADSIIIDYKFAINTKDNLLAYLGPPPTPTGTFGDYDPRIYAPIDFRVNDTSRVSYQLSNKYAYDDGFAEYGAGLNQSGAQIAYRYDLLGVDQETVTFLEMYFPRFGDESSQVIELRIWNDLTKDPVYTEVTSVQRSEKNKFWLKQLTNPVNVNKTFWVGWKQSSNAVIALGLDKSNDTFDRMSYNTSGSWINNTLVHGSLMIRPIFGAGAVVDPTTGLEPETTLTIYPNPSNGVFYIQGAVDGVTVYDMTGRVIPHAKESTQQETIITVSNTTPGIYIIRAHIDGTVRTSKVMIR